MRTKFGIIGSGFGLGCLGLSWMIVSFGIIWVIIAFFAGLFLGWSTIGFYTKRMTRFHSIFGKF